MDKIVKLNAQAAGRDKIARFFQYLSKIIWNRLQKGNRDGVDTFKNLEYQLSSFRKLLRFGKCIDTVYSILPLLKHDDSVVKTSVILGRISTSIFLLADHILWLGRSDLCSVDTDKWSRICSQYWLYSIIMNLSRDLYGILKILQLHMGQTARLERVSRVDAILKTSCWTVTCLQNYPELGIDLVKNICDLFLPLAALGYMKLSPGTIGLFGTISSLAGLIVVLSPTYKLPP